MVSGCIRVGDRCRSYQIIENNGVTSDKMMERQKILIEVMYKADYCLPCLYMDETVREVLPKYEKHIHYKRVDFMRGSGKERFLELSYALFGEDNVRKYRRVAPVPSLFIEGELVFDAIPPIYELEEAIEEAIQEKGVNS
jgi:thiol-disulfide isomerase/thioredoxin